MKVSFLAGLWKFDGKKFENKAHGVVPGEFNLPEPGKTSFITNMTKVEGEDQKTPKYLTLTSGFGAGSAVVFAMSYL